MKTKEEIVSKLLANNGKMRIITGTYNKKAIKELLEDGKIARETVKRFENGRFSTYVFITIK